MASCRVVLAFVVAAAVLLFSSRSTLWWQQLPIAAELDASVRALIVDATAQPTLPTLAPTVAPTSQRTLAPTMPPPTDLPTLAPTLAPTAKPTLAPTTTSAVFPLWEVPSPNTSVKGTFGDYEWVFPATLDPKQYMKERYVANEFNKCAEQRSLCCALGSNALGRGSVGNACKREDMRFQAEFQLVPPRPLFSLVDVLVAWQRAHPAEKRFKLLVIGDSIGGQVFMAALCELARNSKVKSITYDWVDVISSIQPSAHILPAAYQESHVMLHGADFADIDFEILFVLQLRWTDNALAHRAFFRNVDMVLVFLGLHYENIRPFEPAVNAVFSELRRPEHKLRRPTLMWFGAPKQHFRLDLANDQVSGQYRAYSTSKTRFCGPVARQPFDHPGYQQVNAQVFAHLTNKLNVSASWFKWNSNLHSREMKTKKNKEEDWMHVHFFPLVDVTSPFYYNKRNYVPDRSVWAWDCTHTCWAPNYYESFWDALYVVVNASSSSSSSTTAADRFPAGTQQFPPLVKWNSTLELEQISNEVKNITW